MLFHVSFSSSSILHKSNVVTSILYLNFASLSFAIIKVRLLLFGFGSLTQYLDPAIASELIICHLINISHTLLLVHSTDKLRITQKNWEICGVPSKNYKFINLFNHAITYVCLLWTNKTSFKLYFNEYLDNTHFLQRHICVILKVDFSIMKSLPELDRINYVSWC